MSKKGPSLEYLKLTADRFEADIIHSLDLSSKALISLGDVGKCPNLQTLNLARNSLTSLDGLGPLQSLLSLDVSYNQLKDLSPLSLCVSLIRVEALSNNISDLNSLHSLAGLKDLRTLNLQTLKKQEANPVCKKEDYRKSIKEALPQVSRIDYVPRAIQLDQVQFDNDVQIDTNKLILRTGDLYGDIAGLDRLVSKGAKTDDKCNHIKERVKDSLKNCQKKQEKTETLLKEIDQLFK